jgi:hypothetical protein
VSTIPFDRPQTNGTSGGSSSPSHSRRHRRLQRIADYLDQSLANPDPLAANVGAISSDLMKLQYRLTKNLNTALVRSPEPVETFRSFLPAIQTCSQLTRQIFRLTDLSYRLRMAAGNPMSGGSAEPDKATGSPHGEEIND